jgi:hypothetical protein
MPFNNRAVLDTHREIALNRWPGFTHPIDHIVSSIEFGLARQPRVVREPGEAIVVDITEGLGAGEIHADIITRHIDDGGNVVVGRRERRCAAIAIDDRPVLRVHVAIPNPDAKNDAPDVVERGVAAQVNSDLFGEHFKIEERILLGRIERVRLREVFGVNPPALGRAIEAFDVKRLAREAPDVLGSPATSFGSTRPIAGTSMPTFVAKVIIENSFSETRSKR